MDGDKMMVTKTSILEQSKVCWCGDCQNYRSATKMKQVLLVLIVRLKQSALFAKTDLGAMAGNCIDGRDLCGV